MSEPIPLERNLNWWWYKLKNGYLNHILKKYSPTDIGLNILEIGPGRGNNFSVLKNFGNLSVLEVEEHFIEQLIQNQQITADRIFRKFNDISIKNKFDIIIALDVLEHIEDTESFIENIFNVLNIDGLLIISVPAYKSLWSDHDIDLKHIKRYNWKLLNEEISPFFNIKKRYGMNYLLLPLRYIQIKLFKNLSSTQENSKFLNLLFLIISKFEVFALSFNINPKFGLSLFTVAQKKVSNS
tara:strand:- start:1372 stop:2091 length:720 start_codon:yes stop_codon:yes gene_type:complete